MKPQIKLIDKDTDISKLKAHHMDWDVIVDDRPYYVVWIDGYFHTIYGRCEGGNAYWAYPRDEAPTFENLIQFSKVNPVQWGFEYKPYLYKKFRHDETEIFQTGGVTITRNGKPFYFCRRGIDEAKLIISHIDEHPLNLNFIDYDKNMIGRKVWFRSEPAIIESFIDGQACVILKPDGIDKFSIPAEFANGEFMEDRDDVKVEIFDKHVYWFRD